MVISGKPLETNFQNSIVEIVRNICKYIYFSKEIWEEIVKRIKIHIIKSSNYGECFNFVKYISTNCIYIFILYDKNLFHDDFVKLMLFHDFGTFKKCSLKHKSVSNQIFRIFLRFMLHYWCCNFSLCQLTIYAWQLPKSYMSCNMAKFVNFNII